MQLFFSPGACALHVAIVAREAGIALELVQVDLATKRLTDGTDFRAIAPKGQVPALRLPDGALLTEGAAIAQYLADQAPAAELLAPIGTLARYRALEAMNFIASGLHKDFGPLFVPAHDAVREAARGAITRGLAQLDAMLVQGPHLLGEAFTIADAYAFNVVSWCAHVGIGLDAWPRLATFMARVAARPSVRAAMAAEGLLAEAARTGQTAGNGRAPSVNGSAAAAPAMSARHATPGAARQATADGERRAAASKRAVSKRMIDSAPASPGRASAAPSVARRARAAPVMAVLPVSCPARGCSGFALAVVGPFPDCRTGDPLLRGMPLPLPGERR
jgi:glutathione S-transferase